MSKRFVTYRTEDAEKLNIGPDGTLKASAGGGNGGSGVTSWNDLTDKPFYEDSIDTILVNGENKNFFDSTNGWGNGSYSYIESMTPNGIIPNYIVFNGVEYPLIERGRSNDFYVFGNTYYYVGQGVAVSSVNFPHADTGEPFCIIVQDYYGNVTIREINAAKGIGTASFQLIHRGGSIKTLDPKYLPNDVVMVSPRSTSSGAHMVADYNHNRWIAQPVYVIDIELEDDSVTIRSGMPTNDFGDYTYDPFALYCINVYANDYLLGTVSHIYGGFPMRDGTPLATGFELIAIVPTPSGYEYLKLAYYGGRSDVEVTRSPLFPTT